MKRMEERGWKSGEKAREKLTEEDIDYVRRGKEKN